MVPILTNNNQSRLLDQYTIAQHSVTSLDLIENVADMCTKWITDRYDLKHIFYVFSGTGNNGADGLAISKLLLQAGYRVECYIVQMHSKILDISNVSVKLQQLKDIGCPIQILSYQSIEAMEKLKHCSKNTIIIDSILGSGLNRPVKGWIAEVIKKINQTSLQTISIDVPSGLFIENNHNNIHHYIVQSDHTLVLQIPKLALFFEENHQYVGNLHILSIGLDETCVQQLTDYYLLQYSDIKLKYHQRKKFSHKGHFGHVYLFAGSKGKIGASILSAKACLQSGAGRVTVYTPQCGYVSLQTSVPEAMVSTLGENCLIEDMTFQASNYTLAVGPGIGQSEETQKFLYSLLQKSTTSLILDADAINILSHHMDWLQYIPNGSILTPHIGEFKRMIKSENCSSNSLNLLQKQQKLAKENHIFIILKGAHTTIATPDGKVYFNTTGNPGMATAGSGDVLTGILSGLLAQKYTQEETCLLGVYLHGLAGDLTIASKNSSQESLIASDIIHFIGKAFLKINDMKI